MSLLPFIPLMSDLIQSGQSNMNMQQQNQSNSQMQELQYRRQLEMWNRQNAYNSPKSQMTRLKEAGLNPNLVYGSGSVVGNTSGGIPQYQAPSLKYDFRMPDPGSNLGQYQDMQIKNAQINNLAKQGQLIDASIQSKALWNLFNDESMNDRLMQTWYNSQSAGDTMRRNQIAKHMDKLAFNRAVETYGTDIAAARVGLSNLRAKTDLLNAENEYKRSFMDSQLLRSQMDAQSAKLDVDMKEVDKKWKRAEKWMGVVKTIR